MEERFLKLETKVAYQENEVAKLSQVVYRQQLTIDRLEQQLKKFTEQLRELGFSGDTTQHQKPPHY